MLPGRRRPSQGWLGGVTGSKPYSPRVAKSMIRSAVSAALWLKFFFVANIGSTLRSPSDGIWILHAGLHGSTAFTLFCRGFNLAESEDEGGRPGRALDVGGVADALDQLGAGFGRRLAIGGEGGAWVVDYLLLGAHDHEQRLAGGGEPLCQGGLVGVLVEAAGRVVIGAVGHSPDIVDEGVGHVEPGGEGDLEPAADREVQLDPPEGVADHRGEGEGGDRAEVSLVRDRGAGVDDRGALDELRRALAERDRDGAAQGVSDHSRTL